MFYEWRFDDLDELVETVIGWDLNFFPLEKGKFPSEVTQKQLKHALIAEASFSRSVEQQGFSPFGYRTFVVPKGTDVKYKWRGYQIDRNMLSLFPPSGELHSVSNSTFHIYTVSFPNHLVLTALDQIKNRRLEKMIKSELVWEVTEFQLQSIHEKLRRLMDPSVSNLSGVTMELELLMELLRSINRDCIDKKPKFRSRDLALKRSIDYIHSSQNIDELSLTKVKEVCEVSERTLQYAFMEQYGMSPKSYLMNYKLRKVNEALKKQKDFKISAIAGNFGFWHMGQFASDYKKYFGELPSETQKSS